MRCNGSSYVLSISVPEKFNGAVDRRNHSGEEAVELLEFLLSEGCSSSVVDAGIVSTRSRAVWKGGSFEFHNFLVNTGEAALRLGVSVEDIVVCIKAGLLDALTTPSGRYFLVVRNRRLSGLTPMRALAAKVPMDRRWHGRGIGRLVSALGTLCPGFPVGGFGLDDVKEAVERHAGWQAGRDYKAKSLEMVMSGFEDSGEIVRVVEAHRDLGSRRWRFASAPRAKAVPAVKPVQQMAVGDPVTPAVVSSDFAPTQKAVDQMVEELAGELVSQAKRRAREILGL